VKLEDLGWTPAWAAAFQPFTESGQPCRVSSVYKSSYRVLSPAGERVAVVSGNLRHHASRGADLPTVGDWVAVQSPADGAAVIHAVLPRTTCLQRKAAGRTSDAQPLAANVDTIALVMGVDGDFNVRRLERALVMVRQSGAAPLVLLNKIDLVADVGSYRRAVEAAAAGAPVHLVSALHGEGVDALAPALLRGKTLVLLGSSGTGKSTLVNRLLGTAEQLTGAVRAYDDRGRHTTTSRQLFVLPGGALLIDTPGIREIQLLADVDAIEGTFGDVEALAQRCRFRDCRHEHEPGCAVRAAAEAGDLPAERLESLRKLRAERRYQAEREDGALQRERKAKWKAIHKAQKRSRRQE
jgi:ribosome biogenesis GTPase